MRALDVITDAYEQCNRLSPGETLSADDSAFALRRLNLLVDEFSGRGLTLYRDVLTSAAQTGHITLGSGSWAAVAPGAQIVSATADNSELQPMSMRQFNELTSPTTTGAPTHWAQDGLSTVYLWPVPTGQTIKLQTRIGVAEFADLTTDYTAPPGWKAAMGASLAVRVAPTILGKITQELLRAEAQCMGAVASYEPAIVDFAEPF